MQSIGKLLCNVNGTTHVELAYLVVERV